MFNEVLSIIAISCASFCLGFFICMSLSHIVFQEIYDKSSCEGRKSLLDFIYSLNKRFDIVNLIIGIILIIYVIVSVKVILL